ncbi:hypothetical protein PVAND_003075 [Polypedilum vanderplanki]|uniref:Uncharacterized protein n=1 Tax=Polypedilum vanderplanki TaxID=319348 RepID=A0A9J6BTD3_POLVA|nr:hypothetical protein PVAND_003075 [Polypedilum vanderplanki]
MKLLVLFSVLFVVASSQKDEHDWVDGFTDDDASTNVKQELENRFYGDQCVCVTDPCPCNPNFGRRRNKNCVCVRPPCDECNMLG